MRKAPPPRRLHLLPVTFVSRALAVCASHAHVCAHCPPWAGRRPGPTQGWQREGLARPLRQVPSDSGWTQILHPRGQTCHSLTISRPCGAGGGTGPGSCGVQGQVSRQPCAAGQEKAPHHTKDPPESGSGAWGVSVRGDRTRPSWLLGSSFATLQMGEGQHKPHHPKVTPNLPPNPAPQFQGPWPQHHRTWRGF